EGEVLRLDQLADLLCKELRAVEPDFGKDDRELLATVATHDVDLARVFCDQVGHPTQDVVTGTMTEGVVRLLEVVDVEDEQRQRPFVTTRPAQLALEGLHEVAAVVDLREAIDRAEPESLFVIGALDVLAGEKLEDRATDLHEVAIVQIGLVDLVVVDVGAVRRLVVAEAHALVVDDEPGVLAGNSVLAQADVVARRTPDGDFSAGDVVLTPQILAVDDHQAGVLRLSRSTCRRVLFRVDDSDDGLIAHL